MVNRPAGGARSKKHERSPYDWYVEPPHAVEQLFHAVDFGDDMIWDGCCGRGTVLDVAKRYGHPTFGSDVIDRSPRHQFNRGNILNVKKPPSPPPGRRLSYVSNPPYGYVEDIAEKIMRHVLDGFTVHRAAFLVPIAFMASATRHRFFTRQYRPSHCCILSERITCPPGHLIDFMDNPFKGGMADYVWIVFTPPHRFRTELVWLKPGRYPDPPRRAIKGD